MPGVSKPRSCDVSFTTPNERVICVVTVQNYLQAFDLGIASKLELI
jgi:hypothetical protein